MEHTYLNNSDALDVPDADLEAAAFLRKARESILGEFKKRIVGQEEVIDELLIALFSQGHCLLVGVPGLAKTLLINSLAEILDLQFNRIQFTPDLMPSDIIGKPISFRRIRKKAAVFSDSSKVPFFQTSCSQTKLTVHRPRRKPHYYNQCRSTRFQLGA